MEVNPSTVLVILDNADWLLQVQAVPTVIGMKDGKVVDRFVGVKDEADLETFVQKLIG